MKIAVVHSFYGGHAPSGEDVSVIEQVNALESAGHEVRLFGYQNQNADDLGILGILRTSVAVASGFGVSPLSEIHEFGAEIVHVHNLFPSMGENWVAKLRAPFVTSVHNFRFACAAATFFRRGAACFRCVEKSQFESVRYACYRGSPFATLPLAMRNSTPILRRPTLALASRVLALSGRSSQLLQSVGIPGNKIEILPNFWAPRKKEGRIFGRESPRRGWVYAGRLSEEKGFLDLVQNWPGSERLMVMGNGPLADLAGSLSEEGVIDYLGFVSPERVSEILNTAEGMIFPTKMFENSPIVYLQALASGTPTIVLPGNVVADDVGNHGTGIVISSLKDLPNSMQQIRQSDGFEAMCRARGEGAFSMSTWLGSVERIYSLAIREWRG